MFTAAAYPCSIVGGISNVKLVADAQRQLSARLPWSMRHRQWPGGDDRDAGFPEFASTW